MAGEWGGRRRVRQREKLMRMIQACQVYCGEPAMEPPQGWARKGLFFGFDSGRQLAEETGASLDSIIMMSVLCHPPRI